MNAVAIDFEQFVQINHSEPVTTSEFVAKAFGKEHKNILRKIEEIFTQVPDSFFKLNFKFNEKLVKVGFGERRDKFYELTKDGFILLVMGFTGKNAMSIKIAYINAFNAIAEKLRQIQAKQYITTSNQNSKPDVRYPTLNKRQQYLIRQAVLDNVAETANTFHSVYKKLYTRFNVYRYQDILAKDFDEAIELLGGVVNPIDNPPVLPSINQNGRWLLVVRNNQIAEVKSLKDYICVNKYRCI
ncbi:Rha family transcriptional regulator [Snodgrassella alvi]|uniref:Rha family transcriptional regulator n=1 Tax=Snodgrassella alvi TaxID=1196083 RepID=UPI00352CBCE6